MSDFEPANPHYDDRVRASFGAQAVMRDLGVTIGSLGPGQVELLIDHQDRLTQQHGYLHAGILSTVMDSACGYAAFSLMPADAAVLTVEFKINLLRPASASGYRIRSSVIKPGRTLTVCEARAYPVGDDTTLATMVGTLMTLVGAGIDG